MKTSTSTRKVVINTRAGGFHLSYKAVLEYAKRKKLNLLFEKEELDDYYVYWLDTKDNDHEWYPDITLDRDDVVLIQVIEDLGESANGPLCRLKIIEIPADISWIICESDSGREWVAEAHRTWE